jgi:hypothetical protein
MLVLKLLAFAVGLHHHGLGLFCCQVIQFCLASPGQDIQNMTLEDVRGGPERRPIVKAVPGKPGAMTVD